VSFICAYLLITLDSTYPVKDLDEIATDSSAIVYHGTNLKIISKL